MTDKIQEFIDAMHENGIPPANPHEIVADDKMHRYQVLGDRMGDKNGVYCLREDASGFAVGWFKSYKHLPDAVSWHSKGERKRFTQAEKDARQERLDAMKAKRDEEERLLRERARKQSSDMMGESYVKAGHPYLAQRGLGDWQATVWMDFDRMEEALLVPVTRDGELVGMQRIYADGSKQFVFGSDLRGSYYTIAGNDTVAVCEGYATAITVHMATGWTVHVAFNAGNLKPVAVTTQPHYIIADEDLWTVAPSHRASLPENLPPRDAPEWVEWRNAGLLLNTGRDKAMEAAAALGGRQVLGPVEGGDWDDVRQRDGLDAVRDRLLGLTSMTVTTEEPMSYEWAGDEVGPSWDDIATPMEQMSEMVNPLGYDKSSYFFLPKTKGQIIELSATGLASVNNLYQLGSIDDYRRCGIAADKAADLVAAVGPMLMDMCHRKGIYEPEKVYGAGAWRIGGTVYLNTGRDVYNTKTGEALPHSEVKIDGVFVKEGRAYDLGCAPLSHSEANALARICTMLQWKRPISGTLLAGWLVIAAVGGALRWRPHVFITGPKGAGKSTVVEMIVEPVLGLAELRQDGGSTEAGLRKSIGDSSRPVVMDEFEGENKADEEKVAKILFWARKAASGGIIVNANGAFRAQSCVCFAAINPRVTQGADADRITQLELQVNKGTDAEDQYTKLLDMIHEHISPEFSRRLVRRTIDNIDALLVNIETFAKHASRILGSKRAGDQIGPMLAGAYMLHATRAVTDAEAEAYCAKQDWSWIEDQQEGTDSERLVRKIMSSMVDYTLLDKTVKMPLSELIARVYHDANDSRDAAKSLQRYGIAVKDGWLCVANTDDNLSGLLADTPWRSYKQSLSRYEGVVSDGKTMRFGAGSPRRYMKIPLSGLIDGVPEEVQW